MNKLTLPIAVATASTTLLLGACVTESSYKGYTGKNRPIGNCRQERSLGSNIKKTNCEPARDDSEKLRTIGQIDSIAGHAEPPGAVTEQARPQSAATARSPRPVPGLTATATRKFDSTSTPLR